MSIRTESFTLSASKFQGPDANALVDAAVAAGLIPEGSTNITVYAVWQEN